MASYAESSDEAGEGDTGADDEGAEDTGGEGSLREVVNSFNNLSARPTGATASVEAATAGGLGWSEYKQLSGA